jgi:hypothetical protein
VRVIVVDPAYEAASRMGSVKIFGECIHLSDFTRGVWSWGDGLLSAIVGGGTIQGVDSGGVVHAVSSFGGSKEGDCCQPPLWLGRYLLLG